MSVYLLNGLLGFYGQAGTCGLSDMVCVADLLLAQFHQCLFLLRGHP